MNKDGRAFIRLSTAYTGVLQLGTLAIEFWINNCREGLSNGSLSYQIGGPS